VGLMMGVLFTVLVQSSSTCTSVIVSMVASGGQSVNFLIYKENTVSQKKEKTSPNLQLYVNMSIEQGL
jgi:hypothetical protein